MNNYQLNNTSVYIGGQCKWDIVVDRVADGRLEVSEFQLTPLSNVVPFNKKSKSRLINTSHSENIKKFVANVKEDFWNTKPDISTHTGIDVSYLRGPRRLKQYEVYKKQFGYLQPMWLEQIHDGSYLKFTFYVYVEGGDGGRTMIDSSSLSLGKGDGVFHNQFVDYLNKWFKYLNITPGENSIMDGNDKVMDFSIDKRAATICGVNINTGQRSGDISIDYTINNLLSQERPLMEADYIISTLFKTHNIIVSQLFNFNFCFNILDLIDPTLFNMVYGKKVSVDCVVDLVHGVGGSTRIPQMSMYSNYEYIPRDYSAPYYNTFDCYLDDDEILKPKPNTNPTPTPKWETEGDDNVLNYLKDYSDKKLKTKNKLSQHIIHWGYAPDNVKMFNFYEGFEGAYIEMDGGKGAYATSRWHYKPFFIKSTNGVSVLNFPYDYVEGNNSLTWLEPKKALRMTYQSWERGDGANSAPFKYSYWYREPLGFGDEGYEYIGLNLNNMSLYPQIPEEKRNKQYITNHAVVMDYLPTPVTSQSPEFVALRQLTYAGVLTDVYERLYQYRNKFGISLNDASKYWGYGQTLDDDTKLLFLTFQAPQSAVDAGDIAWSPLDLVDLYLPTKDDNNKIRPNYTYYEEVRAYRYKYDGSTQPTEWVDVDNLSVHPYNPETYGKYVRYNGYFYLDMEFNGPMWGYRPGTPPSWRTPVDMDVVPGDITYNEYDANRRQYPEWIRVDGVTYGITIVDQESPNCPLYFYHETTGLTPEQKHQAVSVITLPYDSGVIEREQAKKYGLHMLNQYKYNPYLKINPLRLKITGGLIDKSGFNNTFMIAVVGYSVGNFNSPIYPVNEIMTYLDKDCDLHKFLENIKKVITDCNSGRYIKFNKELAIGVDGDGEQCYYKSNTKRSFPFRSSGKIRPFITEDPKYANYTYTTDYSTGDIVRVEDAKDNWCEYLFEKENFYYVLLDQISTSWEDDKVEEEEEIITKIKEFVGKKYNITDGDTINYIYSLYYKHYFCDLKNIDKDGNTIYKYDCKLTLI